MIERVVVIVMWIAAAVLAATLVATLPSCARKPEPLTPSQGAELNEYGRALMRCEIEARAANSFTVFDACAKDAGLK